MRILLGLVLAALIGYIGYRRGSLAASGLLGAVVAGTTIFALGGWDWGALLVVFFVSSSLLSHFKSARKEALAEKFSKGSQRDLGQVLANGGVGALMAIGHALWPNPLWWTAFAGAVATVNADTWATELGVLSGRRPRLVTNGRIVEAGTSGAISAAGTLAALAGAALIGLVAAILDTAAGHGMATATAVLAVASVAGVVGSLVDSLLGATVQAIYFCDRCGRETERRPVHNCGTPTRHLRGWRWLDNDWVNFISSAAGSGLAVIMLSLF